MRSPLSIFHHRARLYPIYPAAERREAEFFLGIPAGLSCARPPSSAKGVADALGPELFE